MKFSIAYAIFCLSFLVPSFVMAKDKRTEPVPANKCTLKNKVFCGSWADQQGFEWDILGDFILSSNAQPSREKCDILYELIDKEYPYSVMKCTYFDSYLKKYVTQHYVFFITPQTRQRNNDVPTLFHISLSSSLDISNICDSKGKELQCHPSKWSREWLYKER